MVHRVGSIIIVLGLITLQAREYTYAVPLAVDPESNVTQYRLHQKNRTSIQLLAYDATADAWTAVLPSSYNPAGICVLPDNRGISFIDNDRIKLFSFDKRSAKTIAFCQLLYTIGVVHWIDSSRCYFHAKQHNRFKIFQSDIDGNVTCLAQSETMDSMYPSCSGDTLFYIQRTAQAGTAHYCIVSTPYPAITHKIEKIDDFDSWVRHALENPDEQVVPLRNSPDCQIIADFGNRPIMFLQMISEHEGFVIEHPQEIDQAEHLLPLTCHWLTRTSQGWSTSPLVTFRVPTALVLPSSPTCLFESIVPLLPYHVDGRLYYVDDIMGETTTWCLNLKTGEKTLLGSLFL